MLLFQFISDCSLSDIKFISLYVYFWCLAIGKTAFCLFVCVEVLQQSQPIGVMSSTVSYLSTLLLGRLSPQSS